MCYHGSKVSIYGFPRRGVYSVVKLDDVARLAGVSKGTASRVLNNRGYISPQTRQKVKQAMKALNYFPNENARNLLRQRSGMIGVVVPTITYPYYSEIISHLERCLKEHDYKMLLCNTAFNAGNNIDYVHTLSKNRVEGAILFNYQLENKDYDAIPFPIVSIDRFVKDSVSFVASNHEQGGLLAANHLIECGCRHVIQVGGSFQELTPWNVRHVKFRETMRKNGIECISYEQASDDHDFHDYREIVLQLLRQYPDTDGFFCNDLCAAAALNAATSLSIRVPEQLKIVGYDGTILSEIVTPAITSIWQDVQKIATSACEILFQRIEDPDTTPCNMLIGVKLLRRGSTVPARTPEMPPKR